MYVVVASFTRGSFNELAYIVYNTSLHVYRSTLFQTTKTPHSSRSGFAMQICAQCNRKFRPDLNQTASCRWHIGVSYIGLL